MRMIDADATVKYLREFRCKDCDRRKGMKNGKIRFCYEIGDAPCRACDIGDTIEYFLDEDISPTVDAVPVVRCADCKYYSGAKDKQGDYTAIGYCKHTSHHIMPLRYDFYCADGERKKDD